MNDAKKYFAELIGTFVLVLMGCGSAVIAGSQIGYLGISFAFGLSVLVMVYAIGNISGCHINPAITVSMFVADRIKGKDAVAYIIAQCIGAVLASAALLLIAKGRPDYVLAINGLGQNGYGAHSPGGYSLLACFIAEVILTGIFLFVIFGAISNEELRGFIPIPIGLSLVLIHLVGIPITGTSVNPARSLGPALLAGGAALSQLWLFWVAPLIGGILAAVIWKSVFAKK